MNRLRDEEGAVTLMLVVLALGLLVSIGLVVDGGAKLRAVQQANRAAEEAARAGTQQVDVVAVQTGGIARLNQAQATAAATSALAAVGVPGSASATTTTVTVTTSVTEPTIFLGLVGINSVTGTGTATAELTID